MLVFLDGVSGALQERVLQELGGGGALLWVLDEREVLIKSLKFLDHFLVLAKVGGLFEGIR